MRRQSIYQEIVEGFAEEFHDYLFRLPLHAAYAHTDGCLLPSGMTPPTFNGYELTVKGRYVWARVYDKQRTIGLLAGDRPCIKAKGFPAFSNSYPPVLRWMRDRFYEQLASITDTREVRRVLMDPKRFVRENVKLPRNRNLWESTIWKESETFPERWDPRTPIWNEWSRFKQGPNKYQWPHHWVRYKLGEMLDQYRIPMEVEPIRSNRRA